MTTIIKFNKDLLIEYKHNVLRKQNFYQKLSIYGAVYVFENYINIQYCINDLFFPVIHILYLYLKIILYK